MEVRKRAPGRNGDAAEAMEHGVARAKVFRVESSANELLSLIDSRGWP